jgi:hypothetical protein
MPEPEPRSGQRRGETREEFFARRDQDYEKSKSNENPHQRALREAREERFKTRPLPTASGPTVFEWQEEVGASKSYWMRKRVLKSDWAVECRAAIRADGVDGVRYDPIKHEYDIAWQWKKVGEFAATDGLMNDDLDYNDRHVIEETPTSTIFVSHAPSSTGNKPAKTGAWSLNARLRWFGGFLVESAYDPCDRNLIPEGSRFTWDFACQILGHPNEELPADVAQGTHNRLVHFLEAIFARLGEPPLPYLPRSGTWDVLEYNWLKQLIASDVGKASVRLLCIKVGENKTLYLFTQHLTDSNLRAVGVWQASAALEILRRLVKTKSELPLASLPELIRYLHFMGVPFTIRSLSTHDRGQRPSAFIYSIPIRPLGYEFTRQDFDDWILQRNQLIYHRHAAILKAGGIVARVARDVAPLLDVASFLVAPTTLENEYGESVKVDDHYLSDSVLSDNELDLLCGLHAVETGKS